MLFQLSNGGSQAVHNVVTPDGRHHGFSQFGSGTFVPGIRTHLSRFSLLDPEQLMEEAKELVRKGENNPLARLSVDENALVVTPYHRVANILRESLRGDERHGTCGHGIGAAMADSLAHPHDAIRAADLRNPRQLAKKVSRILERFYEEFRPYDSLWKARVDIDYANALREPNAAKHWAMKVAEFSSAFRIVPGSHLAQLAREGNLIFEGAQGVLLDEWHGFHPHTTWSTTTFGNALTLLSEFGYEGAVDKVGVLRAYFTRHGAGPFPTEDATFASLLKEMHNSDTGWQRTFRVGWFDAVLARYALAVCGGIDSLAITNIDRAAALPELRIATGYQLPHLEPWEARAVITEPADDVSIMVRQLRQKPVLTDLVYQETLTALLKKARPVYDTFAGTEQFLDRIEHELGVPITITSHGPTAADKRLHTRTPLAA